MAIHQYKLKSSYSASNGLEKKPSHSIFNSFPRLARWMADREAVAIHRLVQEITRQRLSDNERHDTLDLARGLLDRALPSPDWDQKDWRLWEQLAPHCRTLLNHLRDHVLKPRVTRIMNRLGVWLNKRAEHGEAEPLYRRALAIKEKSFGPEHPDVATGLNNLAELLSAPTDWLRPSRFTAVASH